MVVVVVVSAAVAAAAAVSWTISYQAGDSAALAFPSFSSSSSDRPSIAVAGDVVVVAATSPGPLPIRLVRQQHWFLLLLVHHHHP